MSFGTESSGKRGISWRHREILDLLHFWGEEKIQEALKSTHRNLDYFQRISEQMAARGHRRSALECRSKTKTMRLEYKKVVAHNARSGNAPITCPYYRELESILRGDASVHPKRLARSMVLQVMGQVRTEQVVLQEGSEELFSHDLVTINGEDIMMSSPCHSGDLSDQCNENGYGFEVDLDTTPDGLNQHDEEQFGGGGQAAWNEKENNPPRDQIGVAAPQGFEAPDTAEAVSPGTRLANIRRRRRGGAVINHAAERFLSQASEEHREEMAMREKEQQATWRWREEESRRQQEFMEETRQERRMFQERWSQNIDVMRAAVDTLKTLGG
ncbi:zinc finger and SCAN domain-containing protein 29-like isoform X2 [Eublepharis macularius]|uniref:Zinc finger and SCAN domain-containing protein 29-like isoform X2 n=1 Tax=Eublepharis macularius TaxID=481883 RepID=A0AA97JBU8_EUBMA|nr:zinc finger and SCAN domain-containing protein 29-like isoform X2 [Eublepharis macularius]